MNDDPLGMRVLFWLFEHAVPWVVLALLALLLVGGAIAVFSGVMGHP